MSRDTYFFRTPKVIREFDSNGNLSYTHNYSDVSTWSGRADASSTPKVNGGYSYPTGYWGHFFYSTGDACDYTYKAPWGKYRVVGTTPSSVCTTSDLSTYGVNAATGLPLTPVALQSRAAASVRKQVSNSDWNLGQDIGEIRETIAFLTGPIVLLIKLVEAISGGNPVRMWNTARTAVTLYGGSNRGSLLRFMRNNKRGILRESAKSTASAWLAYKYAWLPLLQTIHNAVTHVQSDLLPGVQFRAHSKASDELDPPPVAYGSKILEHSWSSKREVEISVTYTLASTWLHELDRLGLTNPLSVAWELLPLSFVLDWFIPVGSFIAALQQPMGVWFLHGYQTTYLKWTYSGSALFPYSDSGASGNFPKFRARCMSFRRDILIGFPLPVPYFRGMGAMLDPDKLVSMLAIAVQRA